MPELRPLNATPQARATSRTSARNATSSDTVPGTNKFWYAVGKGLVPKVYKTYEEAERQVSGVSNAKHKRFRSKKKAQAFVDKHREVLTRDTPVRNRRSTTRGAPPTGNGGAATRAFPNHMGPEAMARLRAESSNAAAPPAARGRGRGRGRGRAARGRGRGGGRGARATRPASQAPPVTPAMAHSHQYTHVHDSMEEMRGVFRPSREAVRAAEAFCSTAHAVLWTNGGGVYITRTDAQDGVDWASSRNLLPGTVVEFRAPTLRLSCAAAGTWIDSHFPEAAPQPPTAAQPLTPTPKAQVPTGGVAAASAPSPHADQQQRQVSPEFARAIKLLERIAPRLDSLAAQPLATPQPVPAPSAAASATSDAGAATILKQSKGQFLCAQDWAYSRTDALIHKQLLQYGKNPIVIRPDTIPEQHCLVYMALPGTAGGIVMASDDTNDSQRVVLGAKGLMVKPPKMKTLDRHSYHAAMSLCFRASQACLAKPSARAASVATALAVLQRESTRQYEELRMQMSRAEAEELWEFLFFVRWMYMVIKEEVPTGFMADAAFLAAAKNMRHRANGAHTMTGSSTVTASAWSVCYKCAAVNSHLSPQCPIISPTVTEQVRGAVRAAINGAPVSATRRQELLRICTAYYRKLDGGRS